MCTEINYGKKFKFRKDIVILINFKIVNLISISNIKDLFEMPGGFVTAIIVYQTMINDVMTKKNTNK